MCQVSRWHRCWFSGEQTLRSCGSLPSDFVRQELTCLCRCTGDKSLKLLGSWCVLSSNLNLLPALIRLLSLWSCVLLSLLQKDVEDGPVLGVPASLEARPEHYHWQSLWSELASSLCPFRYCWCTLIIVPVFKSRCTGARKGLILATGGLL